MADHLDSFSNGTPNEYVTVCLSEIRKEMQCPICLGIIRKTRTVMECLHRFCRECIDKSMRLGNNECPACRTHCASRRSLRDDPKFDSLIAALYPDLEKYEEEEMALLEDETRRNKQIQASIAETFKRQSEAVARRRVTAKATAAAIVRKAHGKFRSVQSRNRGPAPPRNSRARGSNLNGPLSPQEDSEKEVPLPDLPSQPPSSSADEVYKEPPKESLKDVTKEPVKEAPKDRAGWRKRRRPRHVEPENSDDEPINTQNWPEEESHQEEQKLETKIVDDVSPANKGGVPSWARAGARSQTRYGSVSVGNSNVRHVNRCVRATALLDYLTSTARKEDEDEYDIHLHLQPLTGESDDEDVLPNLERPYLCCSPNMTVHNLCKHLVNRLSLAPGGELELLVERISGLVVDQVLPAKVANSRLNKLARGKTWASRPEGGKIVEVLPAKYTLKYILSHCWDKRGDLDLLYRRKS
ncbi:E3 ubiquitin-protein ligase RNF1/2 [Marchantia polymorpha subsp. ruderalis]|uniref:RING-type domain-containing protein n=2 Tax=Marchantia polymorpha TaxID=3197 RepID=A0AAF6AQJ6_MARPO|nr:hypothetical protein MARPO_0033s0093 [Marchantia polymorpha]BBM98716.1 hypothetical protein Mp_1g15680 [Marchantia polymorpha subsp. ruderalis]|eukprot:PTQ41690.1 hypothetical protein MARPO_0033s0093 [Marchantia polymorpha]